MLDAMTNSMYFMIFVFVFYGVFAPWYGAKIMMKTGESERFWFFVLLLANFWGFLFLLIRPSFRKGLPKLDTAKLALLAVGYWVIMVPTWAVLGAFS
jgi:hypothetical protein